MLSDLPQNLHSSTKSKTKHVANSFVLKTLLHLCYTILASLQVHILFSFCRLELIFFSTSFSASHRKNGGKSGKTGRILKPKTVSK